MSFFFSTICFHSFTFQCLGFPIAETMILFYFFITSCRTAYTTTSVPFYLWLHLFHTLLSCSYFTSVFNESFLPLCETHLHCSAEGKAAAEGEEMRMNSLRQKHKKRERTNKEVWPVIYQNNGCVSDRKTSLHTSFGILHHCGFIYIFFPFDAKTYPFKRPKIKYKHNHLHLKVLSHRNHREGHPPPPPSEPLSLSVINGVIIFPLLTLFPFW